MNFETLLVDVNSKPLYECSVCKEIGLISRPGEIPDDFPINICHNCGYIWKYNRNLYDEKLWFDSWKENGSIVLYDLPLKERCQLFEKITDSVNRKKYFCLTDEQIKKREIDIRVFTQHGFKRKVRLKRIIVDCVGEQTESYRYETNKLINIAGNDGYISIIESHKRVYLLASDYLSVDGEGVSCPVRHFYPGLMPYLFAGVYSLDKPCLLRDKDGKTYNISIK